jgi:hypothetical protein
MKKVFNKSVVFLLICLGGFIETQAIKTINVREKNGNEHHYALQDIRKLTFSSNYILINKTAGVSDSYLLSDIRYLNFGDNLLFNESVKMNTGLILFPNPVPNVLNLRFPVQTTGCVQIISLDGKILHHESISNKSIDFHFDVSKLKKGFYFCIINTGEKIETVKFTKQ